MDVAKLYTQCRLYAGVALRWWLGELCAMIPNGVRRVVQGTRRELLLDWATDALIISRVDGDQHKELARFATDNPTEQQKKAEYAIAAASDDGGTLRIPTEED